MAIQETLTGQFDEGESLAKLKDEQRWRLEQALAVVGLRPKHTAYRVAMLVHHVAVGDQVLRWSATRIADDNFVNRSVRSVRAARKQLAELGLVEFVLIKSIDGGDDLKAMRLERATIAAAADGQPIATRQSLQAETHPEDQGEKQDESQPEKRGERRGENSGRLYGTIESSKPLNQQPTTSDPKTQSVVVVVEGGEVKLPLHFGLAPEQVETAREVGKKFRSLCHKKGKTIEWELVWRAACLHCVSDWDCLPVAESVRRGVNNPKAYLRGAIRNAIQEAVM